MTQPVSRRTRAPSHFTHPRRKVSSCLVAALFCGGATAADTSWTGNAGPGLSFWDLAANWSAGAPSAPDTQVLLGAFDTVLRSGSYTAHRATGTGTLTMTGGELVLTGAGSSLGTLTVQGGRLVNRGSVSAVGVHIGTSGEYADGTTLNYGLVPMGYGHLVNEGRYVKTGSGTTSVSGGGGTSFENLGEFTVNAGQFVVNLEPAGDWRNTGHMVLNGGSISAHVFRGWITQSGQVDVNAGTMSFSHVWSGLDSTGTWNVAEGATLRFSGSSGDANNRDEPLRFLSGSVNNEGTVSFAIGETAVAAGAQLTGRGSYEVLQGGTLSVAGSMDVGGLRVDERRPIYGLGDVLLGYVYSSVHVGGALTLDRLVWGMGGLSAAGGVTVNGPAQLHGGAEYWEEFGPVFEMRVSNAFQFNGQTDWSSAAPLVGNGSLTIGMAGRFNDLTTAGAQEHQTIRLEGGFTNHGQYVKAGNSHTVVDSAFTNAGTVRAADAGTLTFARAFDNTGSLEAERSRIVVYGPLAQLQDVLPGMPSGGKLLSGGRYVMHDGTLVLNPGAGASGAAVLQKITMNQADIVLDGPQARMRITHLGSEYDALDKLDVNQGRLTLLNGAQLRTAGVALAGSSEGLSNSGIVQIGTGSVLDSTQLYDQSGADAATWLGGELLAHRASFSGGLLGAGLDGEIGLGRITGSSFLLEGFATLDVDIASLGLFDQLLVSGAAQLGGSLWAEFASEPVLGTYRILTADAGINGTFSVLGSNLDTSLYRLTATYGANYVDLTVAAVPEPETYALMALGLAAVAGWTKRRRRS